MTGFERILLVVKESTDPEGVYTRRVQAFLTAHGVECPTVAVDFYDACPALKVMGFEPQAVVVIGGDGTFLRAAGCFAADELPMVGINRGHLGFLTRIETDAIEPYLERFLNGQYHLEKRMLLELEGLQHLALNDVVFKSAQASQLIRLSVSIGGAPVATFDADGLIVATPTGSTAYNLAAGGPVVAPTVQALCLTPICPHSLSAKPIVVPVGEPITIEAAASNLHAVQVSADGQEVSYLQPGQSLVLRQAKGALQLVNFEESADNFYWLLSRKLQWAGNPRLG